MMNRSPRELAYRYDVYIAPIWREPFDEMVEKHVPLPTKGTILEVNSGTGGLALDLASRIGMRGEVVATERNAIMVEIARAKAAIKRLQNLTFLEKDPTNLGLEAESYGLVIGDATLLPPPYIAPMVSEMARVAEYQATVALKLITRGSFDECYSILWEALHRCGLDEYAAHVEALSTRWPTVTEVQEIFARCGLRYPHCFVEREEFLFETATDFFESPLIEDYFLPQWLTFLPDAITRQRVQRQMARIIERERHRAEFNFSVKATLALGRKG
ncbi:MAG: class I SAM-dependent methyltransferase [Blastocatellia bacterium]|nr:class I SAM-dependent methyltransferase [Blastocatellia bacterium]